MKKGEQRRGKIKVVVVDDHELVREGLRLWLEGMADVQQVGEAEGAKAALRVIREAEPDIVLMDVVLAEGNGLDAAQRIHHEFPAVKVIVLSAHCDEGYVQRAMRAGAAGYVLKDVNHSELGTAIRAVHKGSLYLSPAAALVLSRLHTGGGPAPEPTAMLTQRQLEILKLLAEGHSVKGIGHQLGLSPKTVDMHKSRMMKRLQLTNLAALVRFALQHKLTKP